MKQLIATILTLTAVLFTFASCSESRLEEKPKTEMTAENIYVNEAGFELGLNGLYSLVRCEREGYGFTDSFGATGLRALMYIGGTDNYTCGAGASGEFSAIYKNWATANVPTDKSLASVFSWLYNVVLAANTVIRYAEESDIAWHAGKREQVIAEAKLVRAWAYRHLTYMWMLKLCSRTRFAPETYQSIALFGNVNMHQLNGKLTMDCYMLRTINLTHRSIAKNFLYNVTFF